MKTINIFRRTGGRVRPASGFTLVEVMVSVVVLVIFVIAFLGSAIASMRSQQLSCNYYKAMTIARNRIQRASEFAYASVLLMSENQVAVDDDGNIVITPGTSWGRRTTLVSAYTNGTPNMLQITVQVNYPDARGNKSVNPAQLSTLRTTTM